MHSCPPPPETPVLSWHRVANGYVGYQRCPCGIWNILSASAPRLDAVGATTKVIPATSSR